LFLLIKNFIVNTKQGRISLYGALPLSKTLPSPKEKGIDYENIKSKTLLNPKEKSIDYENIKNAEIKKTFIQKTYTFFKNKIDTIDRGFD
jgi:hypothetical protein